MSLHNPTPSYPHFQPLPLEIPLIGQLKLTYCSTLYSPTRGTTADSSVLRSPRVLNMSKDATVASLHDVHFTEKIQYDDRRLRQHLNALHWSTGFIEQLLKEMKLCPKRYFLIDDSGSMFTNDAHQLIKVNGHWIVENTSRWMELIGTVKFHAKLAQIARWETEFRFLNNHDPIVIGDSYDSGNRYNMLENALKTLPAHQTPLCRHMRDIIREIEGMAPVLKAAGQKVKIIIATDGEASDGDLADTMKPLEHLPVWIVLRLCSESEKTAKYWADIDAKLELNMDVVQNPVTEAKEVYAYNPWLNYSEQMHRLRESGVTFREADFLDEKAFTIDQIHTFCKLM